MRPEKAKRVIDKTLQRYLNDEPTAMYVPDMLRACYNLYAKQLIWHKEHGYDELDYTPDVDTAYNNIRDEVMYISDRFDSPQRLAWLITGIEENKF